MLDSAAWGRARRDGVRLPLAGRPNVGKSSVFNALIGAERAIVTTLPGTTRDRVSEAIEIAGVVVTLSDTAGLRETDDAVEAIGVRRTRETLEESGTVLWVVDGSAPLEAEDLRAADSLAGKRVLVALNKRDLGAAVRAGEVEALLGSAEWRGVVELSAARGDGIEELRRTIAVTIGVSAAS
ncbi:MAG: GTP-binding protein, partial [Candidatus Eisenbacteria bacterium]